MNQEPKVKSEFVEPQYQIMRTAEDKFGRQVLGISTNTAYGFDPKHLLFRASRYKFVAKLLEGSERVLEVGCGDAFMTRIVQQHVGKVVGIDIDPVFIDDAQSRYSPEWPIDLRVHDMISGPLEENFDAAFSLDVLEHIPIKDEKVFLQNVVNSLSPSGTLVVGMPSLESQTYASRESKEGHINCKSAVGLKKVLQHHFHNVFIFSMNDEVVHTGFHKMANYLVALCVAPRAKTK